MNGYTPIDPLKFTEVDMPIIIVEEDKQGLIGGLIRWKSAGNYNHIETMYRPGFVVSQDPCGLRELPIQKIMDSRTKLKFWKFDPLFKREKELFIKAIEKDLNAGWWAKRYDFLGIIGQALGIRWIQSPWRKFCSERIASELRVIERLKTIIPKQPTPAELNKIFKTMPDFKVIGYWFDVNTD